MTDEELFEAAGLVDVFLSSLVRRYDMSIEQLNGVMNARLLVMNEENGNVDDYLNFLENVVMQPRSSHVKPSVLQ
jgi:hypothetical protein